MALRRVGLVAALLGSALLGPAGCDEPEAESQPTSEATPPSPASPGSEPVGEDPSPDTLAAPASPAPASPAPAVPAPAEPASAVPAAERVPAERCQVGASVSVGPAEWTDVIASSEGFFVAALHADGLAETLRVIEVSGASLRVVARAVLEHPAGSRRTSGPVLARRNGRLAVAYVDGASRLRVAVVEGRPRLSPRTAAEGASLRFRPAFAGTESGWCVAWTDARDTPMRVRSRPLQPDAQPEGDVRDLTPLAGGAAAPEMVAGAVPPRVVFLDPRQATSVSLTADWTADGFSTAEVARPVGLVTEPPELASVRIGRTDWLAYTGIGNLATTAIGFVPLGTATAPDVLVPGTGYGTLHVDADTLGAGAVIVADAPTASPPRSPRELHLHRVDADGSHGDPIVIAGPNGAADRGRIAARSDGTILVSFRAGAEAHVVTGRCPLPSPIVP